MSRSKIFPGGGAGTLDPLISLLHGWGKDFIVLVDSDKAGETQKKRYEDKFEQIVSGRIFTFENINAAWKGYRLEQLIDQHDIEIIRKNTFPELTKLGKKQLHIAIQELIMRRKVLPFSKTTLDNFEALLNYLDNELNLIPLV
jgi:hypothetical protein